VTVLNVSEGTANASASISPIAVDGDPSGAVSSVVAGKGDVSIVGTETDPNAARAQLTVTIDGRSTDETVAGHYDLTLPARAGDASVNVIYQHSGQGEDVDAGSWTVHVAETDAQHRSQDVDRIAISSAGIGPLSLITFFMVRRRRRARTR
jgi:hypothetical protein